jgi:hypothetical protein
VVHDGEEDISREIQQYVDAEFDAHVSTVRVTEARGRYRADIAIVVLTVQELATPATSEAIRELLADIDSRSTLLVCDADSESSTGILRSTRISLSQWRVDIVAVLESLLPSARTLIVEKYSPLLYLGLSSHLDDSTGRATSIQPMHSQGSRSNLFVGDHGIIFPGSLSLRVGVPSLPIGKHPRTFCAWVYFLDLPDTKGNQGRNIPVPQFLFSYGLEAHGGAFGIYYGVPYFPEAMMRYAGLRVFFWSSPVHWDEKANTGDTAPFAPASTNEWVHVAVCYDGEKVRAYANGTLVLTTPRDHSTSPGDILSIGGFLPGREEVYSGFKPRGYIREFMGFDRILSGQEIRELLRATASILGLRELP